MELKHSCHSIDPLDLIVSLGRPYAQNCTIQYNSTIHSSSSPLIPSSARKMESGYLWSVTLTRSNASGKCETLRMELQFALYAKTKNILLYFGEVSKTTISKSIVWKRSVADA